MGREKGRERERNIDLLFHLFMHSLADSSMCPDQEQNLQPFGLQNDAPTNWATLAKAWQNSLDLFLK